MVTKANHDYHNPSKAKREESKRVSVRNLDVAIAYSRIRNYMLEMDRMIDIRGNVISRREKAIK